LVYINGDLTLPGCPRCGGRIDIQQFVTEVSVDAGTEPGGASASFTLSIPIHHNEAFARDAQFVFRPGLEVHVYERGYFPVKGLYSNLDDPRNLKGGAEPGVDTRAVGGFLSASTEGFQEGGAAEFGTSLDDIDWSKVPPDLKERWRAKGIRVPGGGDIEKRSLIAAASMEVAERYWQQKYPGARIRVTSSYRPDSDNHKTGAAVDFKVQYRRNGTNYSVPPTKVWAGMQKLAAEGRVPDGGFGLYVNPRTGRQFSSTHYDFRGHYGARVGDPRDWWVWLDTTGSGTSDRYTDQKKGANALPWLRANGFNDQAAYYAGDWASDQELPAVGDDIPSALQVLQQGVGAPEAQAQEQLEKEREVAAAPNAPAEFERSALAEFGLQGQDIENILAYPYYHVFHGVVTNVSHSYSGGVQTVTVNCASMLHFWQYQRVSTNAALFGARPTNSKLRMSLVGHNFTGMHPYEIIYTLHHDVAGSAAGVGWALSSQTNQDVRSDVTGESLFSLNLRYWERRFRARDIKLRMHGASGHLFNAAQAAWLSQTSSAALTRLMRRRFKRTGQAGTTNVLSQALSLGLFNNRRLEALQYMRRTRPGGANAATPKFEMNMGEMQAFVANIGNFGQVELFESTYESKQDIAVKVSEVTGFEFYQDVDGDFVFKPPFYNLDTSTSRVYRIEDIDLINISFDEKEPEVTYMTVKGSHFRNTQGTGLEGEWGVRGQYIDYRLVAQFGWRPGDYETAYFNDPKSMFFAAVTRMDVMNVPSTSASLTIPLRPELRPGYPIYIKYLDCFYYCTSFAHSFSVGGECTTSLQLVGKRAKFYAPGRTDVPGVGGIDLSNTRLPQKPLEVLGKDGRPRLAGFPNVVMALDPEQLNPLFFLTGSDTAFIDNPDTLKNLLEQGVQLISGFSEESPGVYRLIQKGQDDLLFYLPTFDERGQVAGRGPEEAINLLDAGAALREKEQQQIENLAVQRDAIKKAHAEQVQLVQKERSLDPKKGEKKIKEALTDIENRRDKLKEDIATALQAISDKQKAFETELGRADDSGIAALRSLVATIGDAYLLEQRSAGEAFGNLDSSANLLEMLSDKKAVFSNGSLPGTYRYYSASHPKREHQGQLQPSFQTKESADDKAVKLGNPFLEALWKGQKVLGFTEQPHTGAGGNHMPSTALEETEPQWGIKVLTNNPQAPRGEVLPTSEIRELMFATHKVSLRTTKNTTEPKASRPDFTTAFERGIKFALWGRVQEVTTATQRKEQTLRSVLEPVWNLFYAAFSRVATQAKEALDLGIKQAKVPAFPAFSSLPSPSVRNATIPLDEAMGTGKYKFVDVTANAGATLAFAGSASQTFEWFYEQATNYVAEQLHGEMLESREQWHQGMLDAGLSQDDAKSVRSQFNELAGGAGKTIAATRSRRKRRRKRSDFYKGDVQSPVFPVSDARGYEVIGAFRYGRDVDIDPEGVFSVLHAQDPLQLLDRHLVDSLVRAFIKGESIEVEVREKQEPSGPIKIVKKRLAGPAARDYIGREALAAWREQLTDQQLLDVGLAVRNAEDPNLLTMNLNNWFANKGKDGVQKVPINNAGYSLADLSVTGGSNICNCKMAEVNVLLEAAGQEDFVQFAAPGTTLPRDFGDGTQDRVTSWLMSTSAQAAVGWQLSRDAIQGSVLDRGGSAAIGLAEDLGNVFNRAGRQVAQASAALDLSEERAQDLLRAIGADETDNG